ncbi:FUSC family protein [Conexibacter sp. DBS9H8]|uniref:FUSC family protein n=1 Tax=Conexibacter sp. DBS9H8 TaxID=2937801 RepID=UPI002010438B|nr:FUSC family protein [Conexibacter sp. DBS9H8]
MAGHLRIIATALRDAARIDRERISLRAGAVAALPVVVMLALGTALRQPVAAITLGVGAMLVGLAWRAGDSPLSPPLETMAAAALMLALATVVGTVTGRWPWLHLTVLAGACLLAGLGTATGRGGTVIGTQTLIAYIVFGRFPESPLGAVRLAGLVLGGAGAQILSASLIAAPLAWRRQRHALAYAYRELAAISAQLGGSGVAAAEAFDRAEQALAAPALFGDPERAGLVMLNAEGRRIRLELLVLGSALAAAGIGAEVVAPAAERFSAALELIAAGVSGEHAVADLAAGGAALRAWTEARPPLDAPLVEARLAALGGQVRAALRQAEVVTGQGPRPLWRLPHPRLGRRRPLAGAVTAIARMRAGASLRAPAGRHAVRLAAVVLLTALLVHLLALPRGYWAVLAAATVLRPNIAATLTRGAERMGGTVLGAVLATLIVVAIDPSGWGIVVTIGTLAVLTYTVFSGSFALGVAGFTAMVVFLLHPVAPDSVTIALDRGLDTLIGGTIALVAYLLWPTWSARALPRALVGLLDAQGRYLAAVLSDLLDGPTGRRAQAAGLAPLARRARIAYADLESLLTVAAEEPDREGGPVRPGDRPALLGALRRLTYAIHALRLSEGDSGAAHPELAPLAHGLLDAVRDLRRPVEPSTLAPGLHWGPTAPMLSPTQEAARPTPRALLRGSAGELGGPVGLALDELVDAVNSVAAILAPE